MNKSSFLKKNGNRRLNVMLGDLCYFNRQTTHTLYVPLAIGMIAQYAKQQFGDDINISLFKNIDKFLDRATQNPPDVVGLSVYYWNIAINQYLIKCLRDMFGKNVVIILGGPTIDNDAQEQQRYLSTVFPGADALILNEGEISFSNIIQKILGNRETVFKNPIDGAIFLDGDRLVQGPKIGLTMDLSTMGSPYLSGIMDEFMNLYNQPLIQTSRFCPYTCAFCVSGKNRGKLRGYPIEQIKEELKYVSKKYADKPHHTMYIVDENFGILKRDVEIAKIIKKCSENYGYPLGVFFYNDKRFTETSRKIAEILAEQTQKGVNLAQQTGNPLSLDASNRRNLTNEEISSAIAWAKKLGLTTSTDLIFGLPNETRETFVETLDHCIQRGFDEISCNNLLLFDGIEMNRPEFRKKFSLKTKYRILENRYQFFKSAYNGKSKETFVAEHEEVVVSSNSFTYEDFLEVRYLNFMFYTVFMLNFNKWLFQFTRHLGINTTKFFSHFFKPDRNNNWPNRYIRFLDDLKNAIEEELHDTREEVVASAKKIFVENGNDVGESSRINMNFGGRLNYLETDWVKSVLMRHLDKITNMRLSSDDRNLASLLIDLSKRERVNLKKIDEKEPLKISFDVINWKKNKFKETLRNLKMPEKFIKFSTSRNQASMINGFQERFASYNDQDYYHEAMEYIKPRKFLLHNLSYKEDHC